MILRETEVCPYCGQWNPWRKGRGGKSIVVNGERRLYVRCRRCGAREVIVYRPPKQPAK